MTNSLANNSQLQWFVMRDLKRPNSKTPAYKQLSVLGFNVFTPMKLKVYDRGCKRIREYVPFIQDLLFVESTKNELDKIVNKIDTLQYRYVKGQGYCSPMVVPTEEMRRFIGTVKCYDQPTYYSIEEITPNMIGARIRMVCDGPLNTFEGNLLRVKGSSKKRLLVQLEGMLAAAVEIHNLEYVEIL